MARDPARVGDHAAGSGGGEDLDVVARDQPGHRARQRRVAEHDDAFDVVAEAGPPEEQPVGPHGVGADPGAGRRFGQQWPAGPLGEDPRGRPGVVAGDDDGARAAAEHLDARPAPGRPPRDFVRT